MVPVLTNKTDLSQLDFSGDFVTLIHKDRDWTSFDVVKKIRTGLRFKKVGHGGTLDPFATGLMLIGVGKGTKALTGLSALSKTYEAQIRFGVTTDTYDRTGQVVQKIDTTRLTRRQVEQAVTQLSGEILQVPPMFSAKKVNGVRLYKLARKAKEVERAPQKVRIIKSEIQEWNEPLLKIVLTVSKGTYIRSYANDLGALTGTGAVLDELKRTAVDQYVLDDSFAVNEFISVYREWDESSSRN